MGKTFREYVTEYLAKDKNDRVHRFAEELGLDENLLRKFLNNKITEDNINEFGRFDELKNTVDKAKAKAYLEKESGEKIPNPKVNIRVDKLLREFIIKGGTAF